jgi:hypothetical protein
MDFNLIAWVIPAVLLVIIAVIIFSDTTSKAPIVRDDDYHDDYNRRMDDLEESYVRVFNEGDPLHYLPGSTIYLHDPNEM